ncbi:hypothetical protein FO675_10700 [Riemerella anatipestifer]|uniref:hypothetical protein n=2 Tax=Riemerella anatipestifer TaxID=34085 RepID=UPI0012B1EF4A|nr:hypothetical protein [Riemerella anatipestifer]MBO4234752.1 hypothetical protein [Riemerella anatipestifer]MSN85935.1 hypothetical protein [Riemerella anatipestifer]WFS33249.1 hypothetical protein D1Y77_002295 [Riemerella anatipestifer]
MDNILDKIIELNKNTSKIDSDVFIVELKLESELIPVINKIYDEGLIQYIKIDSTIILASDLHKNLDKTIKIDFIVSELKKIGYYATFDEFVIENRFKIPEKDFYIKSISFDSKDNLESEEILKYKAITNLINQLTIVSKFKIDEHIKTICLIQDNSFLELEIDNIVYEEFLEVKNITFINQYISDITSYKEKKSLFIKELINFLSNKTKKERFNELILYFEEFYEKCGTSFEYYLSNFSFNKIKLELDNSVLDYSKNIRAIINDSQSKLIAIPAAFILGASQIDYTNPFALKNCIIVISAFLFSYIISIFINNQINAIEIIEDNLTNYKSVYKRSKANQLEDERELDNLKKLIIRSFNKTEKELSSQQSRLGILQYCNWGISVALLLSIFAVFLNNNGQELWQQLTLYLQKAGFR